MIEGGFREFYGVITNPSHEVDSAHHPIPHLPFLDEEAEDPYTLYGLNEKLVIAVGNKHVPLFTPKDFMQLVPLTFGGIKRDYDTIAREAANNRTTIYRWYKTLESRFVQSVSEVNCNTVAYLYEYLNDGEKWKEGMEWTGYVDGLWEIGGYITVSIDTPNWDVHTALHELGHSISYFLRQDLFEEWYQISTDKSEQPPTDYGKTEVAEDFAESFGFFWGEYKDRIMMQKSCPKRSAFMSRLYKISGKALLSSLVASPSLTSRFKLYDTVVWES